MSTWAQRTADKYISRDGKPVRSAAPSSSEAERVWFERAEVVHAFLRRYLKRDPAAATAIRAFERIGDAIAKR